MNLSGPAAFHPEEASPELVQSVAHPVCELVAPFGRSELSAALGSGSGVGAKRTAEHRDSGSSDATTPEAERPDALNEERQMETGELDDQINNVRPAEIFQTIRTHLCLHHHQKTDLMRSNQPTQINCFRWS